MPIVSSQQCGKGTGVLTVSVVCGARQDYVFPVDGFMFGMFGLWLSNFADITCGVVWCFAPIWGCLFYSHKSIGSEGLSLASLAGKRLVLGVCLLKGRGI